MIATRLKIPFEQREYSALMEAASADLRDVESQVRFFVREALERRGLLIDKPEKSLDANREPKSTTRL